MSAKLKHLLNWHSQPRDVWDACLKRALWHGENRAWLETGRGNSIGLVFFNSSLRTRTSMEQAASELGARYSTLNMSGGLWGIEWDKNVMDGEAAEHIEEAVGVLSRYYQALGVRVFAAKENYEDDISDKKINQIASHSSVPILNLESAMYHPCQALADATTLARHFKSDLPGKGKKFVLQWCYHPKALPMAVPNSSLLMAARSGFDVVVSRPDGFELDASVMKLALESASSSGGSVSESNSISDSLEGAEVVYAKAWGGHKVYSNTEEEAKKRAEHHDWKISAEAMASIQEAVFMHCLPVRRGVVVDASVLKSPESLHLEQAENRLHAQKAILEHIWNL